LADGTQITDARTIIARIERLPNSPWHTRMRAVIGAAWFFDAFDALTIAFVLPALIPLWHLNPFEIGLLIATGYAGQAIGSVFTGWYADRVGRVPCAVWTCAIFAAFSLACAFAWSFPALVVLRFLQGLGLGGEIPIVQSYINEFTTSATRGRFALLTQLPFAFGILVTSLVGVWVVPHLGWQWMFVIGALPAALTLPLRKVLPESPRWLASVGRYAEADATMTHIEALVTDGGKRSLPPLPALGISVPPRQGHFADLFRGRYAARTIVIWVLWFTGYMVSYGLSGWMPSLYRAVYHLPLETALLYSVYSTTALFIGGCMVTIFIDRTGRKPWLVGCLLISGVALAVMFGAPGWSAETLMLVGLIPFFGIGAISLILGLYTAENYPTHLRSLGAGVGNAWLRVSSVIGPFLVGWVLQDAGLGAVFLMFGIFALIGGATAALFAIETRGRLLEELSPVA
jgi:putative MFS transporter